jgi:carbon storage regulator
MLCSPKNEKAAVIQGGYSMLILSRSIGQRAIIAGNIHVIILDVRGGRVKLGFEGPAEVPIHREEVHKRTHRQQAEGFEQPQFACGESVKS